ncbi:hypothetical protein HL658_08170 [Azospirillum sp. RWY-5-1]|uniref:Uncharacterized protein n=1 Tax=Azospirillum oleiclasticum TaxID=2735135 RepID=A0ABX2T5T9_9PROT|nr:hypothetical protein [Azospirillum oleiclasticum]NYZ12522.1 hypothetical protein [Azospirillum oleiclasticum]NYZ19682.1 hypothetical protein [Azospirillum oleiclasticum]
MSFGDRVLGGLRSIVPIEERVKRLDESLATLGREATAAVADHEKRLIRLETITELHRPDGTTLRITPPDRQ